jgi:hypothetical protein
MLAYKLGYAWTLGSEALQPLTLVAALTECGGEKWEQKSGKR